MHAAAGRYSFCDARPYTAACGWVYPRWCGPSRPGTYPMLHRGGAPQPKATHLSGSRCSLKSSKGGDGDGFVASHPCVSMSMSMSTFLLTRVPPQSCRQRHRRPSETAVLPLYRADAVPPEVDGAFFLRSGRKSSRLQICYGLLTACVPLFAQIGVQHTDNAILKKINRGHDVEATMRCLRLLKDNCFKVYMFASVQQRHASHSSNFAACFGAGEGYKDVQSGCIVGMIFPSIEEIQQQ